MNRITRTDPCFNAFLESEGKLKECREPVKQAPAPAPKKSEPVKFNSPDDYIQPAIGGPMFLRMGKPTCIKL